jgi:O-glycosyl hydrolase
MYRNYDGNKSKFGDMSVAATVPNPDAVSAFAALRTIDGALTLMVINKSSSGSTTATINVSNFAHGATVQAWQLTSANTIARLVDVQFPGASLSATLPAQSITLFVIPGSGAIRPPTNLKVVRP